MNNQLLQLKIKQRLNKLSSSDYENLECWMIVEAFNKAMDGWVSRQLEGINQTKSTAEGSIRSIDKLQVILKESPLTMTSSGLYWSTSIPDDYMEWCRVSASAEAECCPPRPLKIFMGEEADRDILLSDRNRQPSFDWATTFSTLINGEIRIYTNNCFELVTPTFTYYRKPTHIQINGCVDPDTGIVSTTDIECEFSVNMVETLIEEAAAILAGDMDNIQKMQILQQNAEHSN